MGLTDAKDYIRNGQNLGPTVEHKNYIQYLVINHKLDHFPIQQK